jgi:trk system potassium uptake protein TrkH
MPDIRPVIHLLGLIAAALGATMVIPMMLDLWQNDPNWHGMFEAATITILTASLIAIATYSPERGILGLREAWLLTAGVWFVIPAFGALPFILATPNLSFTDAFFEAASGLTTTGSTVITGLDSAPRGLLLWRAMLNWMGGLGIVIIAMIFLPIMRVGGMQMFRAEGFDTFGKILPRAGDISRALLQVYVLLTLLFAAVYAMCGMTVFEALLHAFATISTGGFSTSDSSFGSFKGAAEYAGTLFMLMSGLPFIRFVQLMRGNARPFLQDPQVRAYITWYLIAVAVVIAWRMMASDDPSEQILRETMFTYASLLTGTGFGSAPLVAWGAFPLMMAFAVGMIGGCTGSSSGAISVFRWQMFGAALKASMLRLHAPHRFVVPRYDGKPLTEEVMHPLMIYFTGYVLISGISAEIISMTGVDFTSALFAVWTSIGNVGYGIGPMVDRTGTMIDFNDVATWVMTFDMLLGRLGLLAILVILLPRFWRE